MDSSTDHPTSPEGPGSTGTGPGTGADTPATAAAGTVVADPGPATDPGPGAGPGYGPPPGYGYGYGPPPGYGYGAPAGYGGWPAQGQWEPGTPGAAPASAAPSHGIGKVLRSATTAWIVAGILALAVIGLAAALANTQSTVVRVVGPGGRGATVPGPGVFGGGGLGGAAANGVVGTVATVGSGSFTVTDRLGQTVTVNEQSSTTYYTGTTPATSSAVTAGVRVLVRGTRSGTTVTATAVYVLPAGGFGFGGGSAGAAGGTSTTG